ncbi:response regulator transcription factor [Dehalogenimonas etheniformans]|uniref:DNA-binding response regulator n=1 Tax=Dehalogenimonas etheniformans TaxID=1536648 RepID=A0A2P5P681_9CHLR|nr:response regulator transcription factor [Dehalogenimonas etheniformans]PPD57818.1 DNA-binding response regulator [Dehalogenimonas etheniformans]QNT77109.1 response regulator transcription factor [Dehalogenimonas etheniformans]
MTKKILVVDDEQKIVDIVRAYLEREGFRVLTAYDGETALKVFRQDKPDLIVLDLMLPKLSGNDVCRIIRKESEVPIIMLTARDELTDKIVGLEIGADDYLTKPFEGRELVARVKAILRRTEPRASVPLVRCGDITVDTERRQVKVRDRIIELTTTEFELLKLLASYPGKVFSRTDLLDRLQGDAYEGYERTIDSHIKNLRRKIEPDVDKPSYIHTIYGAGYKLELPA